MTLEEIGIIVGIVSGSIVILEVLFSPIRRFRDRRKQLKAAYEVV